jgi:DNA-binding CsgD family transcriptional regulator/HAMP domain-containing protein
MAALVTGAILCSGAVQLYVTYQGARESLETLAGVRAAAAAAALDQYLTGLEQQIAWIIPSAAARTSLSLESRQEGFDVLLRQAPVITEVAFVDSSGRERLRVSRYGLTSVDGGADLANDPRFIVPRSGRVYVGPVYTRNNSEPYVSLAMPEPGSAAGVIVAEINLTFVRDTIARISAGNGGYAYVVDSRGQLLAHPDRDMVLRTTNLSTLPQVAAALSGDRSTRATIGRSPDGQEVLTASSGVPGAEWYVFVEQPAGEAFAPLYALLNRTLLLLLGGIALATAAGVVLALRMARPIRALRISAAKIGAGELTHRIQLKGARELEDLAAEFNRMAEQLEGARADLQLKLDQRTSELHAAVVEARSYEDRLRRQALETLSPREREVAALLAQGLTNHQIAMRLTISDGTAKVHVEHILAKLGLETRGQVAAWALDAAAT